MHRLLQPVARNMLARVDPPLHEVHRSARRRMDLTESARETPSRLDPSSETMMNFRSLQLYFKRQFDTTYKTDTKQSDEADAKLR